jgi:hypothetical protein
MWGMWCGSFAGGRDSERTWHLRYEQSLAGHPRNAVISLGKERCLADMVLLRRDEFVFGFTRRDGQKAPQTDGIKRAIGVAPVRK